MDLYLQKVANISSLHALYLSNNQLTGNIPQELANLNLGILDVSFNQLTGTIPPLWTAPISLLFSHNHLTGNIPPELANAGSGTLDLSYNELTGSIPPELGNLTNLSELNLSHNHLTGTIPAALGNNSEFILTFNLGANQLSGTIPAELGNFPYLCTLDLSSNLLQGEVPENITNLNHLNTLDEDCVAETNSHLGLSFNMLKADNQTTATFLTQKAPDWSQTQTVPPTNLSVSVSPVGNTSALLNWTPIPYTGDNGYYIVYSATTPGGPYTQVGTTANKSASSFQTSTLLLGHSYYFVIRTYTPLHGEQQNSLLSPISSEVSLTTPSPTQLIQQLISTVESFNLQQGIQNSFDAKLQNAQDSLSAENAGVRQDAINKLQAFIQAVEAQSGNKITTSQADLLVNSAQSIINGL